MTTAYSIRWRNLFGMEKGYHRIGQWARIRMLKDSVGNNVNVDVYYDGNDDYASSTANWQRQQTNKCVSLVSTRHKIIKSHSKFSFSGK